MIEVAWLLVLGLGPLLMNPWSQNAFDPPKAMIVLAGAAVLTLLCLAGGLRRVPLLWPGCGVLATYGVSTALSYAPIVSWKGNYVRGEIGGTVLVLAYAVLGYAVAQHLRERRQAGRLCAVVAASGALAALYALVQAVGLDPIDWYVPGGALYGYAGRLPTRPGATFGDPNLLAFYLILALPFVWRLAKVWRLPLSALAVAGVLATSSRGAALGLLVIVAALCCLERHSWRVAAGLTLVVLAALLVGHVRLVPGPRLTVWSDVFTLAARRPVFGWGPDTLGGVYRRSDGAVDGTRWEKTDNRWLDAFYERGAAGVAADLVLVCAAWRLALRRRTPLAHTALAALAGGLAVSLVDATPISGWALEWVCCGLIATEPRAEHG